MISFTLCGKLWMHLKHSKYSCRVILCIWGSVRLVMMPLHLAARGCSEKERLHGSPIIRRSTIGSSYGRETGSSSPTIYHPSNRFGEEHEKKSISNPNENRHSLHVLKDQAVQPVGNNQKRWSNTEDKMVKSHTISAQLMGLENDRNFKTSNFKSRSM